MTKLCGGITVYSAKKGRYKQTFPCSHQLPILEELYFSEACYKVFPKPMNFPDFSLKEFLCVKIWVISEELLNPVCWFHSDDLCFTASDFSINRMNALSWWIKSSELEFHPEMEWKIRSKQNHTLRLETKCFFECPSQSLHLLISSFLLCLLPTTEMLFLFPKHTFFFVAAIIKEWDFSLDFSISPCIMNVSS